MAIYQYNRRFFVRKDKSSTSFIEIENITYESETNFVYDDNELEEKILDKVKKEIKLPDGYYYYKDPDLSHRSIDLNVETSFNVFFNIGLEQEYKKKEIQLRPMYIGYMINDRGDMLFKLENEEGKLNKYVHTVYTWPLDLKTKALPLVSFKGENCIIKGKGISHDIVDSMYGESVWSDTAPKYSSKTGRGWTKFADTWFIALRDNKGYENKTMYLKQYCVRMDQFHDGYNIVHTVYKGENGATTYFDELKLLNEERKAHGRDPINIIDDWYEPERSFYVFTEPKVVIGYDELDPAENVEKYRHKKTHNLPADVRINPSDYYSGTKDIEGDECKFNLKLPYDYYFILKINIKDNKKTTKIVINNVIVFESFDGKSGPGDEYVKEYVLNSLNQTSSSYNNLKILNFNVELEQGENIIQKENCSIYLEVRLIQGSVDYV